jgi:hypothetical protein
MLGLRLGSERWSEDPERPSTHADWCPAGAREPGHSRPSRSHGSPHGLYRALILAHGQRVTWPPKWAFTREYGHAVSLLIMVCF